MDTLIKMEHINKYYINGNKKCWALYDINLCIKKGEFVAIIGTSGSGKSTLINILGCLDTQSNGNYILDNKDVNTMNDNQKAEFRNRQLGFVFQKFNLLQNISALDNVKLPLMYRKENKENANILAFKILEKLGLKNKIHNTPKQMSGGQQQRVAVARAIITDPNIILADEPTGNLDTESTKSVMNILKTLNDNGKTVIVITHDNWVASCANRIVTIKDGLIVSDKIKLSYYKQKVKD